MAPDVLDRLVDELEAAAQRLRDDELSGEQAARLVGDCARLASDAASELDGRARAASAAAPVDSPSQLRIGQPAPAPLPLH